MRTLTAPNGTRFEWDDVSELVWIGQDHRDVGIHAWSLAPIADLRAFVRELEALEKPGPGVHTSEVDESGAYAAKGERMNGWQCPQCGSVYAPFVGECQKCNHSHYSTNTTPNRPCSHCWCKHVEGTTAEHAYQQCCRCGEKQHTQKWTVSS